MPADPCEVLKNPAKFNGKMVSLRGKIGVAFENFSLDTASCSPRDGQRDYIWLEYGSGPEKHPTIWCCGSIRPKAGEIPVLIDDQFKLFYESVQATNPKKNCYDCFRYDVTATLIGRLDYAQRRFRNPDGQEFVIGGFGHMGHAKFRLVIQAVTDVQIVDFGSNCAPQRCHCEGRKIKWFPQPDVKIQAGQYTMDWGAYRTNKLPGMILVTFDLQTLVLDFEKKEVFEIVGPNALMHELAGKREVLVWDTGENSGESATTQTASCGLNEPRNGCRRSSLLVVPSSDWIVLNEGTNIRIQVRVGPSQKSVNVAFPRSIKK